MEISSYLKLFDGQTLPRQHVLDKLTPRRWQLEAFDMWVANKKGIVSVVTGGGKTRFAYICMLEFNTFYPDGRIYIIVPTTALLDQWYITFIEDYSIPKKEVACTGGGRNDNPSKINIMVVNSARTRLQNISFADKSFLIVDECHRAGSPSNSLALKAKYAATLGLSATPNRENDNGLEEKLVPALGNIIYTYDYTMAHSDKVISDFQLINVEFELLENERKEYERLTDKIAVIVENMNLHDNHVRRKLKLLLIKRAACSSRSIIRIPVTAKLLERDPTERTIIFHESINSAVKIAQVLEKRGHNPVLYHSKLPFEIRQHNLLLFRRGIAKCIIACRSLDEGIDVPATSVGIIASSTSSSRQRIQRLGRILRPSRDKEISTIYTLFATTSEKTRLKNEEKHIIGIADIHWKKVKV